MGQTWTSLYKTSRSVNKDMGHVFNSGSSAKVIRVYKIFSVPDHLVAATAALDFVQIWRQNAVPTGGTSVTPIRHHTDNSDLDAGTTAGFGKTVTNQVLLRRILSDNTPPNTTSNNRGHYQMYVPYAMLFDAGLDYSEIQPLTCPIGSNCGYGLFNVTSVNGSANTVIEFTSESS